MGLISDRDFSTRFLDGFDRRDADDIVYELDNMLDALVERLDREDEDVVVKSRNIGDVVKIYEDIVYGIRRLNVEALQGAAAFSIAKVWLGLDKRSSIRLPNDLLNTLEDVLERGERNSDRGRRRNGDYGRGNGNYNNASSTTSGAGRLRSRSNTRRSNRDDDDDDYERDNKRVGRLAKGGNKVEEPKRESERESKVSVAETDHAMTRDRKSVV